MRTRRRGPAVALALCATLLAVMPAGSPSAAMGWARAGVFGAPRPSPAEGAPGHARQGRRNPLFGRGLPRTGAVQNARSRRLRADARATYGRLPLRFELNVGQTDPRVRFLARGGGYTLFLTPAEAVLALTVPQPPAHSTAHVGRISIPLPHSAWRGERQCGYRTARPDQDPSGSVSCHDHLGSGTAQPLRETVLRLRLAGANPHPQVVGLDRLPGITNYFIGRDPRRWHTSVPSYARVEYRNVYPGVDLVYYGHQGRLEYDLVVAPHAALGAIRLAIAGARQMRLDARGNLELGVAGGQLVQERPRIYQETGGVRRTVAGGYLLRGGHVVGFALGRHDARRPLVIDPGLVYSTYLGGSSSDEGYGIAVDGAGNAYIAGGTDSVDFPTTPGAFQTNCGGCPSYSDAFVSKLNASGSALVYSTYLGGSSYDAATAITLDGAGNVYVTGSTDSSDFPIIPGAFQTTCGGIPFCGDAFVSKLNASGSTLLYSTFLGGSTGTVDYSIAVDGAGNAYVTGATDSSDFPTTGGAFQTNFVGGSCGNGPPPCTDAFVSKLDASGSALLYSTFLGGSGADNGSGIAVDGAGNAYIAGYTSSSDFPTTPGTFQPTCSGGYYSCNTAFVSKLDASGSALLYSTYLGGSDHDLARSIAVDGAGNAYVTGETTSIDFPTTPGAFQTTCSSCPSYSDAFVSKLNTNGSALLYSTFLGGGNNDVGYGVALDNQDNAYVTGWTDSPDFPTTSGAFQTTCSECPSNYDAFVSTLNTMPVPAIALAPSSGYYGQTLHIAGARFGAAETVNIYADHTNRPPLYTATTDATGAFALTSTVDQGPHGLHTLIAVGQTSELSATAPFTVEPTTSVQPSSAVQGARSVVSGYGFGAGETVTTYWQSPHGLVLGITHTNAYGTFSGSAAITFTVPMSPTGSYPIISLGQTSGAVVTSTFTLRPYLRITPSSGTHGSTATVVGTGYGAHETVAVRWNCAKPTCRSTTVLGSAATNGSGDFGNLKVTIPATATVGTYAVGGKGATTHAFANTFYTVTS